jgi:hypothetical protein
METEDFYSVSNSLLLQFLVSQISPVRNINSKLF